MSDLPWLTITVFVPVAGALVLGLLTAATHGSEEARRSIWRWGALAVSVVAFVASLAILFGFETGRAGLQMAERASWAGPLNLRYALGVDGVSLGMVLLTTLLMPLSILASWRVTDRVPAFMASMLVLETAMLGTFLATDLLLFFVFFEGMLFPMYLIIGAWGGARRVYAAVKFFIYTMAGSALLLAAILFLYFRAGADLGAPTFELTELAKLDLPLSTARWLFLAFFLAFAVKVPLFPLHTWLPDAHVEAPTAGSVILAGILLKIGAYGLIRFNLGLFPEASVSFRELAMVLAVIGIIYGAVVALAQSDIKRLVAYSSVSHLGFVVLGIFAGTTEAMSGGVLQMINHGLSTGALFLLVGMLYERLHTRDLDAMGGLASRVPWFAGVFLFVSLSSLGLPGLNGFVGEFLILVGSFVTARPYAAIGAGGIVLAAIYLLWAYQRAMHGEPKAEHEGIADLSPREWAVIAPLVLLILAIGVYPKPFLDRIEPDARRHAEVVAPFPEHGDPSTLAEEASP